MMRRLSYLVLVMLVLPLVVVTARDSGPTLATYIIVTSSDDDYTDGYAKTCSGYPTEPCTLRRAINQARNAGDRPVYIEFNIPLTDAGYLPALGAWKIQLTGSSAYDLREVYGQTIIDGSTQPDGRPNDPKIIVDGQDTHNMGLILRQNNNQVRGLAFQNFEDTHISISSDNNLIEDCWFGLSDDGLTLSSGSDTTPELDSGVAWAAGSDANTVRNNVFAGFFGAPVAIRSNNNVFTGNKIGTRADGTVPLPAQFDKHPCLAGVWTGGSGITVDGDNNQIGGPTPAEGNLFAGLFLELGPNTTQGPAMSVNGEGHLIQNNIIGLDIHGAVIGVCGRGLDFAGGPEAMQVLDNVIVETGLSGVVMNNWTLNGNTLWGNLIWRESPWPGKQGGNQWPENAIAYGPFVPQALKTFAPAQVTGVTGTAVTGTSGNGSPCPNCTVELFLDDTDSITETLQSLDRVTADGSGNWTATLPAPLEGGQGLRTMSTVPDDFTITGLDAGTTSNLSTLQEAIYQIFLPLTAKQP